MAWAIQWDGHNANSIIILYEEKKLQASLWALGAYIYMYWICCRKFPQQVCRCQYTPKCANISADLQLWIFFLKRKRKKKEKKIEMGLNRSEICRYIWRFQREWTYPYSQTIRINSSERTLKVQRQLELLQ